MTKKYRGTDLVSILLLVIFVLVLPSAFAAGLQRPVHKKRLHHQRHRSHRDRIAEFVATVQPKKGKKYARRVAQAIRRSARTTGIAPDVLLATGYVESELRMTSGPCIGMMQVHPRTLREMRRRNPTAGSVTSRSAAHSGEHKEENPYKSSVSSVSPTAARCSARTVAGTRFRK